VRTFCCGVAGRAVFRKNAPHCSGYTKPMKATVALSITSASKRKSSSTYCTNTENY
jgi:hypothetical protein